MKLLVYTALVAALCVPVSGPAIAASHGTPYANTGSPIGTNLSFDFGPSLPFLNAFKVGGHWFTATAGSTDTGEETYLYANCLDANGYPITLTGNNNSCLAAGHTYDRLQLTTPVTASSLAAPYYPGGNGSWELMYDGDDNAGSSNFTYTGDATFASHSCAAGTCTDILNVSPSAGGMRITLAATDTNSNGKYVKNIRLVQVAQYNALSTADKALFNAGTSSGSTAGIFFNPDFLAKISAFRSLRFMDWNSTNVNGITAWSARPVPNWYTWNDGLINYQAVPFEVMIALANKVHATPWLNINCGADTTYMSSSASLTLSLLDPSLSVIVENCNEAWNTGALAPAVYNVMIPGGMAAFPSCANNTDCLLHYFVWRSVLTADAWKAVWTGTNSSRVLPTIGVQTGNNAQITQFELPLTTPTEGSGTLWTGTAGSHFYASNGAMYYAFIWTGWESLIPQSWTADADGGMAKLQSQALGPAILPSAFALGNCGNGVGISCTPVTNTAYTLCSNVACNALASPSNQQCVLFTSNANSGATPVTMAVDGGTPFTLQGNDGVNIGISASTPYDICFTSATSAGAVSPAKWQMASFTPACGSEFACLKGYIDAEVAYNAANFPGLTFFGYEGGFNLKSQCFSPSVVCGGSTGNPLIQATLQKFLSSPQGYAVTQQMMAMITAEGVINFNYYTGVNGWGGQYWGWSPGTYSTTPTSIAPALYDYIRRTPCGWANCRAN